MALRVRVTGGSVIVRQYRYFYYLANELAHMAMIAPASGVGPQVILEQFK